MKITILSEKDYAASAIKLADAISLHTDHDIKLFTGKYRSKFKHPQRRPHAHIDMQHRVNRSDVVHLKGDFPPNETYMGIKISHKPIIVSVSGSHFRKKKFWGYGNYGIKEYDSATIKTAFTPDLCYPEYSSLWTPHPIDSMKKPNIWRRKAHPLLIHTPTNRENKDTAFILAVFNKLSKRMKIETAVIENEPFKKVVELRKEATIFFDQFRVGFYGNSALEAMQYGIPTAAWISPMSVEQSKGRLESCPVITAPKKVDLWAKRIEEIIDNDLEVLSARSKQWCNDVHSFQAVAKQWNDIYNAISLEV